MRISLEKLLEVIPRSRITQDAVSTDSRVQKQDEEFFYYPPQFTVLQGRVSDAPLILISASGASGKSALAKYISKTKNAFVWDLGKIQVGDGWFTGVVGQVFGKAQIVPIFQDFNDGKLVFIFDAFDEAETNGWSKIEIVLREILSELKTKDHPTVLLLARSSTAEYMSLFLDMQGLLKVAHIELDYFDKESAVGYILQSLDYLGYRLVGRRDSLAQSIKSILEHLEIFQESDVNSLAGYPPVLDAVVELIRQFDTIDAFVRLAESEEIAVNILPTIMRTILLREQEKSIATLILGNPSMQNEAAVTTFYSPEIQIRLLDAHCTSDAEFQSEIDAIVNSVPEKLREAYSAFLRTKVPVHPFVRDAKYSNFAFRDYVSIELRARASSSALTGKGMSPIFWRLFFAMSSDKRIVASDVPSILASISAGVSTRAELHTYITEQNNRLALTVVSDEGYTRRFNLELDEQRELRLPTLPSGLEIDADIDLLVGDQTKPLVLANTSLKVSSIFLLSPSVEFVAYETDKEINLICANYAQELPKVLVLKKGEGRVIVSWATSNFSEWTRFKSEKPLTSEYDYDVLEVFQALRKILSWFRRDKKASLARAVELVDNVAIGGNRLRGDLLKFLIERQVVDRTESLYRIDESRLSLTGTNWMTIREGRTNPDNLSFIMEFLIWQKKGRKDA